MDRSLHSVLIVPSDSHLAIPVDPQQRPGALAYQCVNPSASLTLSGITMPDLPVHAMLRRGPGGFQRGDIEAAVGLGVRTIALCGIQRPQDIRDVDVLLREFELARGTDIGAIGLSLVVDSAAVLLRCDALADVSDRVGTVILDSDSFVTEMGIMLGQERRELDYARSHVVTVASAHGFPAYDMAIAGDSDEDTRRVHAFGFAGRFVSTLGQVQTVNRVFAVD